MAYNNRNKLIMYQRISDIVKAHYITGVTTYKGIWREYVYPVYPISYNTFLQIINTGGLLKKIEENTKRKYKGL